MSVDDGYRRPARNDTFDLRDDIMADSSADEQDSYDMGEPDHSVMEEDDDEEQHSGDDMDDSSSLSIPNETIDFDLVYSLHTFVATVEGQANVVKGDSLFLMDDSNSYWWLVRVLKTQEIGYIPAENVETPFERLARLNKHRNVDLASATQQEQQEDIKQSRERLRVAIAAQNHPSGSSPQQERPKSVVFTASSVYYYPPFVWGDPNKALEDTNDESWQDDDDESYEEGEEHKDIQLGSNGQPVRGLEPDDGMSWDDEAGEQAQSRSARPLGVLPIIGVEASSSFDSLDSREIQEQQELQQPSSSQRPSVQQSALGLGQAPASNRGSSAQGNRPMSATTTMSSSQQPQKIIDPAEVTITRKISATPSIARDEEPDLNSAQVTQRTASVTSGTSSISVADTAGGHKRPHEETADYDANLSDASSKKLKGKQPERRLVKQRSIGSDSRDSHDSGSVESSTLSLSSPTERSTEPKEKEKKKKKGGLMESLFGLGKKKEKKENRAPSVAETDSSVALSSTESVRTASTDNLQRGQEQDSYKPVGRTAGQLDPVRQTSSPVSVHSLRMQQKDQEQQLRYQQYLKKSPSSPPDPSVAFGTQSAASQQLDNNYSNNNSLALPRPRTNRPGSLILANATEGAAPVPDLSVLRVFAGDHLQSEATFKTVLINASTTATELIHQAMQRFRLPAGETQSDYYLSIKQMGGDEAILRPDEHPLGAFEALVERVMQIPTVRRSSVGSFNSDVSNLSMHPAITKLGMNDFTDDSHVKFYLHRRLADEPAGSPNDRNVRDSTQSEYDSDVTETPGPHSEPYSPNSQYAGRPHLTVNTPGTDSVSPERFSSPSSRFAVQVVIYPEDLPDGMVFDPHTEAIVPRSTLQHRSSSSAMASPGISQTQRKKIFIFPRNTTVAEVIEASLERFGIVEGVVEGGDDIEDKLAKRRSATRVRYGLAVSHQDGPLRELQPSSKILDAFVAPPLFKVTDRRASDQRRRSAEPGQLLGTIEDVQSEDPAFILRRATGLRNATPANSRSKIANSLDELALHHLHRESAASDSSARSSMSSSSVAYRKGPAATQPDDGGLTARNNGESGVDVLVPDRGTIRSARRAPSSPTVRYSFIQPDGETYDISDIIEEEWATGSSQRGYSLDSIDEQRESGGKEDLLEGALRQPGTALKSDIDRVLNKLPTHNNTLLSVGPQGHHGEVSPSVYSEKGTGSRAGTPSGSDGDVEPSAFRAQSATPTPTPTAARSASPSYAPNSIAARATANQTPTQTQRTASPATPPTSRSPIPASSSSVTPTPTSRMQQKPTHQAHPSIASIMSDLSTYTSTSGVSTSTSGSDVGASPVARTLPPATSSASFAAARAASPSPLSSSPAGARAASPGVVGPIAARAASASARAASPAKTHPRTASPLLQNPPSRSSSRLGNTSTPSGLSGLGRSSGDTSTPRAPDEMGISRMLALIELGAIASRPTSSLKQDAGVSAAERERERMWWLGEEDPKEVAESLHPRAKEVYGGVLEDLDQVDKKLDQLLRLARASHVFD